MEPSLASSHFLSSVVYIVLVQLGMQVHAVQNLRFLGTDGQRWAEFLSFVLRLSLAAKSGMSVAVVVGINCFLPKFCAAFGSYLMLVFTFFPSESCKQCTEFRKGGPGKSSNEEDFLSIYLKHSTGLGRLEHFQLSFLSCHDFNKIENTGTEPCCQLLMLCLLHLVSFVLD